jgi:hypothetical protein
MATDRKEQRRDTDRWTRQYAHTGTETVMGLAISRDYSRKFADLEQRVKVCREMRSEPAVDMALKAGEKLILGAHWPIVTEGDGGEEREVVDFLEDNLYPRLDELLRWLLGAWQFGWATVEPVLRFRSEAPLVFVSQGRTRRARRGLAGKIYLHRLVHLVPESIEGFAPDADTGELGEVRQNVYVEGAGYQKRRTPGWKVLHAVHEREGDDWSGRPMLRAMFMPWDVKLQLLRSFAVHWDRFGVGTPHMQAGPEWEDRDYERAEKYLKDYRAGTSSFLITPFGGQLSIFAGEEVTKAGPLAVIQYLDGLIAKVALAQILELGTTATGHRALGDSFLDMLESSLQAFAEYLAALIQTKLIVPLVDLNFGPRDDYPQLLPAVTLGSVQELVTTITSAKTAGLVGWTARDEARLRDMMELPEIDVEARQQEMDEEKELRRAQIEGVRSGTGEEPEERSERVRALAHSPDVQAEDTRPTPALALLEREAVQPRLLADRLDSHVFRAGAEVDDVLREVNASLAAQAVSLAERLGRRAGAQVASIETPLALRRRLEAVLRAVADRARSLGAESVRDEVRRQEERGLAFSREEFVAGPAGPADASAFGAVGWQRSGPVPALLLAVDDEGVASIIEGQVGRAVLMELDRRENTARAALLRAIQEAVGAEAALVLAVRRRVMAELDALSPAVTRRNLEAVVNVAFGVGRQASAEELIARGEIAFGVRSEVMDANTCGPCRAGDGTTLDLNTLRAGIVAPPFPDCEGRELCRGLIIYVRRTERPASA